VSGYKTPPGYDRIFWLEKTLLAFEHEPSRRLREARNAEDKEARHQIAHDDIALNINWETGADRRITELNCSVSADVKSTDQIDRCLHTSTGIRRAGRMHERDEVQDDLALAGGTESRLLHRRGPARAFFGLHGDG
jgi:hypothetical protein